MNFRRRKKPCFLPAKVLITQFACARLQIRLGECQSDSYLYCISIKDTPVCGHLDFNCLKLKYEVLKLGVWMSDPYLYCNSIKDTHVCGHLDFNCLKLKYGVNHDILLFSLAPGYTVSTWGCVVLTVYDRHRC